MGSLVVEAVEASKALLERGVYANVIAVTSPELLLGILGEQDEYRHLREGPGHRRRPAPHRAGRGGRGGPDRRRRAPRAVRRGVRRRGGAARQHRLDRRRQAGDARGAQVLEVRTPRPGVRLPGARRRLDRRRLRARARRERPGGAARCPPPSSTRWPAARPRRAATGASSGPACRARDASRVGRRRRRRPRPTRRRSPAVRGRAHRAPLRLALVRPPPGLARAPRRAPAGAPRLRGLPRRRRRAGDARRLR